jgi:hypothetical protein
MQVGAESLPQTSVSRSAGRQRADDVVVALLGVTRGTRE